MKLLLLINPVSGRGRGEATAKYTRALLERQGHEVVIRTSDYPGHLTEIAEREVNGSWDGIVALGGDGTLFEIINGMMRGNPDLPIPLGVVPVGSGNSFSRDLAVRTHDDAIENITWGKTRDVDLGKCICEEHTFYFINILGFGFVSDVARKAVVFNKWGVLKYLLGIFFVTIRLASYRLDIEADGCFLQRDNVFAEICNSTKTGGDMYIAPKARIDDGLFDVVLLNRISRLRIIPALPKLYRGTHTQMPEVETFTAKEIVFRPAETKGLSPDGELFGRTPIKVSVLPKKIRVFDKV